MFKYPFLITAVICAYPVDIEAEEKLLDEMKQFATTVDQGNDAHSPVVSRELQRAAESLHQLINAHERVISLERDRKTIQAELSHFIERNHLLPTRVQNNIRLLQEMVDSSSPSSLAVIEPMKGRQLAQVMRVALTGTRDEIEKGYTGETGIRMYKRILTTIRCSPT